MLCCCYSLNVRCSRRLNRNDFNTQTETFALNQTELLFLWVLPVGQYIFRSTSV